jgi:ribonuclease BN (tRNA processing enzyme)
MSCALSIVRNATIIASCLSAERRRAMEHAGDLLPVWSFWVVHRMRLRVTSRATMRIAAATVRFKSSTIVMMVAFGVALASPSRAAAQTPCSAQPLAVQVLGSGGPYADGTRASTGYLIWRNGRAVMMVDAGGGTFLRFGEAGARLQDLALLAISHVHPDHVSDLPALLWLSEQLRERPLKIAGPSGAGAFPSIDTFIRRLFDAGNGAFPVLGGTLGQPGQGVRLDVVSVDAAGEAATIWSDGDLEVRAIGVPHGSTPSIAYRVRIADRTVVFGSDQNGSDPKFVNFAANADVMVMHFTLSQKALDPLVQLHARPATVGQVAQGAKVKRLVLSHFVKSLPARTPLDWFSLFDLDQAVAEVRKSFAGPIETANDLQCIPLR